MVNDGTQASYASPRCDLTSAARRRNTGTVELTRSSLSSINPVASKEIAAELAKRGLLDLDCLTVTGKTVGENIQGVQNLNHNAIRPIEDPYSPTGGLQILWGNLAPHGCVVKRSAVAPEMLTHTGPARVFDSEEDAIAAIYAGRIVAGDVVVIRYEGPKGGPGMREMLNPTSALAGMGLDKTCLLYTSPSPRD